MDPCFYRREITNTTRNEPCSDAIIILHVDDMRVAAAPALILADIHSKLFAKFDITTSDTGRFLGMDADYNLNEGILRMHMETYITSTMERFDKFDLSLGIPFREIVGSLLWIVVCIMGPELLRVKDLARKSNAFTLDNYNQALTVLHRLYDRKSLGIIYRRGGAGKENVPRNTRLGGGLSSLSSDLEDITHKEKVLYTGAKEMMENLIQANDKYEAAIAMQPEAAISMRDETNFSTGDQATICEFKKSDLYKLDPRFDDLDYDIPKILAPTNGRFTVVAYSDASFAVGDLKQSISGFLIMINGIPILWGS
jgi:hypothetical protein